MQKLATWGNEISATIFDAIDQAATEKEQVTFEFNGVTVIVDGDSDLALILRDWRRGMAGYLGKDPIVGPHPIAELTAAQVESDARIEAENEERRKALQREYEKKAEAARLAMEGALAGAGPIELKDPEGWATFSNANQDGYGSGVVRFAERWARLMQQRMSNGETIQDCAEDMSRLADSEGITGFMYGCAVHALANLWIHGEELRRWHNLDTQIGTEGETANENGGVLNPAILNIGK